MKTDFIIIGGRTALTAVATTISQSEGCVLVDPDFSGQENRMAREHIKKGLQLMEVMNEHSIPYYIVDRPLPFDPPLPCLPVVKEKVAEDYERLAKAKIKREGKKIKNLRNQQTRRTKCI